MDGFVQFRFAQGAPDKEQRFHKALEETQGRHNSIYPTLFAFHGSRLENWHSIIRSGLDFRDTLNGRACGHGVYHSLNYNTSIGYSREWNVVRNPNYLVYENLLNYSV
jgi:ubiquitin-conjugating enzyme E2 Q